MTTGAPARAIPVVHARGTPFELGLAHGRSRASELRGFLDDGTARLDLLLPAPVTVAGLAAELEAYGTQIRTAAPPLYDELRGLAAGAGITLHEALLLQTRREILGYRRVPTAGDCTTYARADPDDPDASVLAQTVDLPGDLDDVIGLLRLGPSGSDRETLVLSFGGLLGYLGLNSEGLTIGINLVLGGRWRPGLPAYLAVRHLLDTTASVDEALAAVRGLPIGSSRSLTLCDPSSAAFVEILDGEMHVVKADRTVHTNHYLGPDLTARDELNVFARNSSVARFDTCGADLDALPGGPVPAEDHFALLARPPICVPGTGDIRTERTVCAVVMFPQRRELHVRPGDPSRSATQVFALR